MAEELAAVCYDLGRRARAAARQMALVPTAAKDAFLSHAAELLAARQSAVLAANDADCASGREQGLSVAQIDRLRLSPEQIRAMADTLREVQRLPDPVGRLLDGGVRPNGLRVEKVSVPLGVILFIYESRPNVTVDAAALAIKSGNAIILRGGKEAFHSNAVLHGVVRDALLAAELPVDGVQFVPMADRNAVTHLLRLSELIDVVIPRGGESLILRVVQEATMPVMKHFRGNCHVYVDCAADLGMATRIIVNAKCQRPGVCNAAESLLVHADVAERFLPGAAAALRRCGVELRGCGDTRRYVPDARPATDDDYAAEFLDLILAVKVVDDLDAALTHIGRFGSGHTEAIVTNDLATSRRFTAAVDAAAVLVNASTRFHDGGELGLGAEIGISTDRLHARGPCGLQELTSYKYVVVGDGHVRGEVKYGPPDGR
jgi:glutamate-5-semialdehyde dehydrogenase